MADGGEATPQQSQQSSEEPLGLRAVLIGATGAVGECLLGEVLCSKVCLMGSISPPAFVRVCSLPTFVLPSYGRSKVHVLKQFNHNSCISISYSTMGCLKDQGLRPMYCIKC